MARVKTPVCVSAQAGKRTPSDGRSPRANARDLRKISPFGRNDRALFFAPLAGLARLKFVDLILLNHMKTKNLFGSYGARENDHIFQRVGQQLLADARRNAEIIARRDHMFGDKLRMEAGKRNLVLNIKRV